MKFLCSIVFFTLWSFAYFAIANTAANPHSDVNTSSVADTNIAQPNTTSVVEANQVENQPLTLPVSESTGIKEEIQRQIILNQRLETVDLADFTGKFSLSESLVFIEETELLKHPEAVAYGLNEAMWIKSTETVPNLGLGIPPHWFAIRIQNTSPLAKEGLFHFPYSMVDYLDVYLIKDNELTVLSKTGDQRPMDTRALAHRHFLVPYTVEAGSDQVILIRAESFGALKMPMNYWDLKTFFEHDQAAMTPQLAFVGLMFGLALYNFFLWISTRDHHYFWYVASMVTISFVVMSFHGILAQFAWPNIPKLNNLVLVGSISANIFSATLFAYYLLNIKRFNSVIRWLFLGHCAAAAIIFVLNFFLPYAITVKMVAFFSVTGAIVGIVAGICLWVRGETLAKFYTTAWFLLLAGSITITFSHFGWLPSSLIITFGQQIGAAAEGLVLSFALAYRLNMERQARAEVQEALLNMQMETNEQLENRVEERTAELAIANEKLLEMSLTDGLTQVRNRAFFDRKLRDVWINNSRLPNELCLLMIDIDHFKHINDQHGHVCGDRVLQQVAKTLQHSAMRTDDFVARYGGEEFSVLLCNTTKEGAVKIAEKIRSAVEDLEIIWESVEIKVTVSIGVAAAIPIHNEAVEQLILDADEALYEAKNNGRNQVRIASAAVSAIRTTDRLSQNLE